MSSVERIWTRVVATPNGRALLRERFGAIITEDGTILIAGNVVTPGKIVDRWGSAPVRVHDAWSRADNLNYGNADYLCPETGEILLRRRRVVPL